VHHFGASAVIGAYSLALLAVAVAIAGVFARFGWLRGDLAVEGATRIGNLDGLRGILAISVLIHHSLLIERYHLFGPWAPPIVALTLTLGTAPVAVFFMITGFLFWTRALKERGRLDVARLYRSRFMRLWPLYAATITVMLIAQLFLTHVALHVPLMSLAREIVQQYLFGYFSASPVNGLDFGIINAGVAWSLAYEVTYYVVLPALALLVRTRFSWTVVLVMLIVPVIHHQWWMAVAFIPGILTAELMIRPARSMLHKHGAKIALGSLGLLVAYQFLAPSVFFDNGSKVSAGVIVDLVLLGCFFAGVVASDRLSLLQHAALRYLGAISYSVYLIHGIVLFGLFQAVSTLFGEPTLTIASLFAIGVCAVLLTVGLSTVSYIAFERPFFMKAARTQTDTSAIVREALEPASAAN
jgi:peptidoglycan/LPS O-acetylase OafA/YrhL